MPLVTYGDLFAKTPSNPAVPVYQTIEARVHSASRPMPPPPNATLGASDLATLDSWIAAGALSAGDVSCSLPGMPSGGSPDGGSTSSGDGGGVGGGDASSPAPDDCVWDTHLAPASSYTVIGQEQYACYGFDITNAPTKRHVTQIRVHIDNAHLVHHALLLESPTSTSGTPIVCSPAPSFGAPMMYAWAPGGNPLVVPPAAGFPIDNTTHYVVQIHYNNVNNLPNPVDASGFDLCTTPNLRPNDADVVAFGTELISLPPRAATTISGCYTIPSSLDGRNFFAAFPHMHQLGVAMDTNLETDGGVTDMGTIASWNFSNQPWLSINAVGHTGDVIKTTCRWNNGGDNTVTFGQSTTDEMCYSFTAYYPKASLSLGWAVPATASVPCP
jgi:hypothetical protein